MALSGAGNLSGDIQQDMATRVQEGRYSHDIRMSAGGESIERFGNGGSIAFKIGQCYRAKKRIESRVCGGFHQAVICRRIWAAMGYD
jgi:hypothetical protein